MKKADKLKVIDKILTDWAEWYSDKSDIVDHGILTALFSVCSIEDDEPKVLTDDTVVELLKQIGMNDELVNVIRMLMRYGALPDDVIKALVEHSKEDNDV